MNVVICLFVRRESAERNVDFYTGLKSDYVNGLYKAHIRVNFLHRLRGELLQTEGLGRKKVLPLVPFSERKLSLEFLLFNDLKPQGNFQLVPFNFQDTKNQLRAFGKIFFFGWVSIDFSAWVKSSFIIYFLVPFRFY